MNGIKYYALGENEEVPYEFVVIRNVNGEPEFYASFVNTNSLAYGNGVLLKLHERNNELRAENVKLRDALKHREWIARMLGQQTARVVNLQQLVRDLYEMAYPECPSAFEAAFTDRMRELGVETNDV